MDPLTQAVLGASLASSFATNEKIRLAAICGIAGGLAPDLDIFIRSDADPLLTIEYHRHFTHALSFIPIGGAVVAAFLYFIFRKKYHFKTIFLYATLGFATHGLLDACTGYGTRLYWPFSDHRVAFNIISIIDPIYTIILLLSVIFGCYYKSKKLIYAGLILSMLYLMMGFIQHKKVSTAIADLADNRGHYIDSLVVKPTIANNWLWRTIYKENNYYYVDAVYMPLIGETVIYEGEKVPVINEDTVFDELGNNSIQRQDIYRFSYFSQGYIYMMDGKQNVIADLRYGTLPNDTKSLWGIEVNVKNKDEHVKFLNLRNATKSQYEKFWQMLQGK
jgi:inner membrane protein